MIAEIIINSNVKMLNRTFDYLIPVEFEDLVKVGSRVYVPFGNGKRLQDGYVVRIKESSDFQVKPIARVEKWDLPKEQVELALLMARRYFCNVSDCIKLMLPPGTTGKLPENHVKDKMGQFVYLKKDVEEVESDLDEGLIKSPKQRRSLEFLLENEGVHILDLESLTDTSRAVTKVLEKNGYVEIVEKKIERDPFVFKEVKRDCPLVLTEEQQDAFERVVDAIENSMFKEFLLYGVTRITGRLRFICN